MIISRLIDKYETSYDDYIKTINRDLSHQQKYKKAYENSSYFDSLSKELKSQNYDNKFTNVLNTLESIKPHLINTICLLKDVMLDVKKATALSKQVNSFRTKVEQVFYKQSSISITIEEYLLRICFYLNFNLPEILYTLILIDRILNLGNIILCDQNIHKIVVISSLLTCKMLNDKVFSTENYCRIYGIPTNTLLELEVSALSILNFSVFVSEEDYNEYYKLLISY
jgi:hypothetical protein